MYIFYDSLISHWNELIKGKERKTERIETFKSRKNLVLLFTAWNIRIINFISFEYETLFKRQVFLGVISSIAEFICSFILFCCTLRIYIFYDSLISDWNELIKGKERKTERSENFKSRKDLVLNFTAWNMRIIKFYQIWIWNIVQL